MPAPRNYYPDAVSAAAATVGRVLSSTTQDGVRAVAIVA